MKHYILIVACALCVAACGADNTIVGENYGNIAAGDLGAILTQSEHEVGWGEADCLLCHNMKNIHQNDQSGTGLNLEAIQALTEESGIASCAGCHGDNGVQ